NGGVPAHRRGGGPVRLHRLLRPEDGGVVSTIIGARHAPLSLRGREAAEAISADPALERTCALSRALPVVALGINADHRLGDLPLAAEIIDRPATIRPGILAIVIDDGV